MTDSAKFLDELEMAYAARRQMQDILHLVAIALGVPRADLPYFDYKKLVGMAQKANTEDLRFAACRHQARDMLEDGGEQSFVKAIDEYRQKFGLN